jgi:histo-blood group ABO system transferase
MWNWKQQKNTSDWYYPMSIDGHVFRAKEILPVIARARYMAPNSLEQALADECPVVGSKMICFEQSKIINIPCNKVQTENTNHAGMLHPATTESLNSEFLKGKQISTENIYGIVCNSVHVELPLKLIQKEAKIGILLIATNRYIEFINPLIESINKFFLTDYEKHFFLFTNKDAPDGVKKIHIDHKPWPNMTLYRYNIFAANESLFQDMDYLYYLDADMIVVDKVGNEILGETVGTSHPGFYNRERSCFTYETNSQSMACISANQGKTYYAGGFVGGSREGFMAMCRTIRKWVDKDASNGITAVWHDESHLNKYFMLHPPQVTLTPDYCHHTYPAWNLPPKIVAIYKVHSEYRDV